MTQDLQSQNMLMTGARQTMTAWSKVLESREEIPAIYQELFSKYFAEGAPFPRVIWMPALNRTSGWTTEKLICDTPDVLYIFEKKDKQVSALWYAYEDVYSIEDGNILLDAWLMVSGKTQGGEMRMTTLTFNMTSKRHFEGILHKLRRFPQEADADAFAAQKDTFNALANRNFKFMNFGRESLLPGETVHGFVFQPGIKNPFFTIFGMSFYKAASLAHMAVSTDRELILIQETGNEKDLSPARYGGIWQYIPLRCVDSLTVEETTNDRVKLLIRCQPDAVIEKVFDRSNLVELQHFCADLQTLIS
ncbi:MAG: hypothetical protein U0V18_02490 [Anaerolineales bacterium]